MKSAPGQEDLLDIPADGYDALRIQAEKFSGGELARVLSLLLAAQNDMRWTTSPRLSLELAIVRACLPETDPTPAGVVARLERLERLANVTSEPLVVEPAEPGGPARAARARCPGGAGRHPEASSEASPVASPPKRLPRPRRRCPFPTRPTPAASTSRCSAGPGAR